jgi:hypothetical protein
MPECTNVGCNESFKWSQQHKRHKKVCKFPPASSKYEKNSDNTYKCNICSKTFQYQSGVIKHLNKDKCQNDEPNEHPCPKCPAVFPFKCRLITHLKKNHVDNNKQCSSCHREFKRKDFYEKHIQLCGEDPNFVPSFSTQNNHEQPIFDAAMKEEEPNFMQNPNLAEEAIPTQEGADPTCLQESTGDDALDNGWQ